MDWRRITRDLEHAQLLRGSELEAFLRRAGEDNPAVGQIIARWAGGGAASPDDDLQEAPQGEQLASRRGFMSTRADQFIAAEEAPVLSEGDKVGAWRIRRLLGAGGMGEVYEAARDDGLYDQIVALKILKGASDRNAARFERERRKLAAMDHPGIARIIDGGAAPCGRPYMAMEFVDGRPIDKAAKEMQISRKTLVGWFETLCAAVAHAHGKLVIHRDIKPDNVLIDATGAPRLIDFGIASDADEDGAAEAFRALTIPYAAPELILGEPLSVRTDIFALGSLLHELLTGAPPEREADGGVSVDAGKIADADLAAILTKAVASRQEDRYPAVAALADDIAAWRERRPVAARNGGRGYRIGRFLQRFPVESGLAAALVAALVIGMTVSLNFAREAREEAARAHDALARAEWNASEMDLNNQIATAYADALQRMTGAGMDVEKVTELLRRHLDDKLANREQDPDNAALSAFAIGRHFLSRNDYASAREVFEAWLDEGYGPANLLPLGWSNLGYARQHSGEAGSAEEAFRRAAALYDDFARESPDYAALLTQIARYSGDAADFDLARTALLRVADSDPSPWIRMTMLNSLHQLYARSADSAGAYEAIRRAVNIIDENASMELQGRDTNRLNLAEAEIYGRGDLDAAAEQVAKTREIEEIAKGASRESARAIEIEGIIARERGDHERALSLFETAAAAHKRFAGAGSEYYARSTALLIMTLVDLELADDARALLAAITAERENRPDRRIRLAEAYLAQYTDGPDAASALLDEENFDLTAAMKVSYLRYMIRILERRGVLIERGDTPP